MDHNRSSEELIERATQGDKSALAELLVVHHHRLETRIKFRVRLNPSIDFTAEDVLQETYIDVFNGISTFRVDSGASFATWLVRVADNRLAKLLRDRSRLKRGGGRWSIDIQGSTVMQLMHDLGDEAITGSERLAKQEVKRAIELTVAALPPKQREAIERHYLEHQDLAQIAEAMRTTKDAVRGLLHRAKKSMQKMLGGSSRWFCRK